ncbi:MAG: menaquinone biosynthetic enzyme MqnA/MqnD family protein [Ktedonobacterales bacterium]
MTRQHPGYTYHTGSRDNATSPFPSAPEGDQGVRSLPDNGLATTAPVRLGVIDYLNVVPVYDWLLRRQRDEGGLPGIETVAGVPAAMNSALIAGDIDVSNVSSFAFGAHADEWLLLPHLSVAAHGRVESVLLFSWQQDWRRLDGATVALTAHSATSVQLVKLLCERRHGVHPRYVTETQPDLDRMLAQSEAALLIGDTALIEGHRRRSVGARGQPFVFDLAAEWEQWTGLPVVFAVWAARVDRLDAVHASGAIELLRESKQRGLRALPTLADEAAARLGLPRDDCERYLRLLDYDLTDHDLRGLRLFLEMAIPGFQWDRTRFA